MTALVAVIVIVLIGVLAANLIRRARTGVRSVRSHHRALDTLGHITTQRPVPATGPMADPEPARQAHIRILPPVVEEAPAPEEVPDEVELPAEEPAPLPMAAWFHLSPAPRNDLWDTAAVRQLVDGPDEINGAEATGTDERADIDLVRGPVADALLLDGQSGESIDDDLSEVTASTPQLDHAPAAHGPSGNGQGTETPSVNGHSSNGHSSNGHSSNGHTGHRRLRRGFNRHRGPRDGRAGGDGGAAGGWVEPDGPKAGPPEEAATAAAGNGTAANATAANATTPNGMTRNGPAAPHRTAADETAADGTAPERTVAIDGALRIGPQPGGSSAAITATGQRDRDRRRKARRKVGAAAAVVVIGAVAAGVVLERHHAPSPVGSAPATHPPTTVPVPQPPPAAAKKTPAKAKVVVKLISNQPGILHYHVTGAARVTLKASGPCWVEVRSGSADGPGVYTAIMAAGTTETVKAPVWVRLGRPGLVAITVGGKAVAPPVIPGEPYDLLFDE